MTPNPGIYHCLGKPVRPTTALIDGHRFVSLWTATVGAIPAHAWDFQEAQHEMMAFSATGVPKAINWGTFPDWFDLTVHWRGYTPEGAVAEDWWHTLSEYVVTTGGTFGIKEKIVEWRSNRILHLRRYLTSLVDELPITVNHIPIPEMDDMSPLAASHPSPAGAFHVMARSRAHFVDLAGFFCYCREAFIEFFEDGDLDQRYPPSSLWTPWVTQKKTGYLLNLPSCGCTHNIPMWLAHNIPVHYYWDDTAAAQPRLSRLDPEFLQAHDEDILGPPNAAPAHSVFFEVLEGEEFNEWLQVSASPGYNAPHQIFPTEDLHNSSGTVEFLFKDYEDWAFRLIDNTLEASFLSEILYFNDKLDKETLR